MFQLIQALRQNSYLTEDNEMIIIGSRPFEIEGVNEPGNFVSIVTPVGKVFMRAQTVEPSIDSSDFQLSFTSTSDLKVGDVVFVRCNIGGPKDEMLKVVQDVIPGYARFDGKWYPTDPRDAMIRKPDWINGNQVTCSDCGGAVPYTRAMLVYDGNGMAIRALCSECADYEIDNGTIFFCESCHSYQEGEGTYTQEEQVVCDTCLHQSYTFCTQCGEWVRDFNIGLHNPPLAFCEHCMDRYGITTCDACGEIISCDERTDLPTACYDEDEDRTFCQCCYERLSCGVIHNYSYKPDPEFLGTDSPLYLGVELEVDCGDVGPCSTDLGSLCDDERLFYMKHDGSLDDGIEIVTQPATLKYHLEEFPWSDIAHTALEYDFRSHDAGTCGLHVHVSRAFLGEGDTQDLNIAKILLLVDMFWKQFVVFSRRKSSQLRWAGKPGSDITTDDDETEAIFKKKLQDTKGRYYAVNLRNRSTVEFRIFRGTLNLETIRATLQMVDNLVRFACEKTLAEVQCSRFEDIVHFHEYSELNAYVARRFKNHPELIAAKCNDVKDEDGDGDEVYEYCEENDDSDNEEEEE